MAVVDYFLKIDTIPGESTDAKHKGEIDVLSWSWGATQSSSASYGGGAGSGKVSHQPVHCTMKMSKASPKLKLACSNGEHIKSAILVCRKAGKEQQEYLTIKLHEVLISSYQTGGGGGDDTVPTDQVALNYAKIEMEYKEQKADGSLGGVVKSHWSVKENKGG